jgi:hypothetical protein
VNNELEGMWKEAIWSNLSYCRNMREEVAYTARSGVAMFGFRTTGLTNKKCKSNLRSVSHGRATWVDMCIVADVSEVHPASTFTRRRDPTAE